MRQRPMSIERLEAIARDALIGGYGKIVPHDLYRRNAAGRPIGLSDMAGKPRRLVRIDVSMDCEDPYWSELYAKRSLTFARRKPLTIVVSSRCRKCKACKERRRMYWRGRAITEYERSPMTLFGTLTVDPAFDVQIDALARIECGERSVDFDRLTPAEMFRERVKVGGREVTKWLKVLRNPAENRVEPLFRYLIVAEAHEGAKTTELKRGRPHWHVLLHEQEIQAALVTATEWARRDDGTVLVDRHGNPQVANDAYIKRAWKIGHSQFALCRSATAAGYLCKYLTKEDTAVRLRASFGYGQNREAVSTEEKTTERKKVDSPTKGNQVLTYGEQ